MNYLSFSGCDHFLCRLVQAGIILCHCDEKNPKVIQLFLLSRPIFVVWTYSYVMGKVMTFDDVTQIDYVTHAWRIVIPTMARRLAIIIIIITWAD